MNIIFLDIDGVLVTFKSQKPESYGKMLKDFDEEVTSLLVKLCEQNDDVRIVLSSTWRLSIEMRELIPDALSEYFIGMTGRDPQGLRGKEILQALRRYSKRYDIKNYVVLDDDCQDIEPFIPAENFIHVDRYDGLTRENFDDLCKRLDRYVKL